MTSIAAEETLRELDEDMRQAWEHYSEQLRELSGEEYERAESDSWDELQEQLRRLDERRASVTSG